MTDLLALIAFAAAAIVAGVERSWAVALIALGLFMVYIQSVNINL